MQEVFDVITMDFVCFIGSCLCLLGFDVPMFYSIAPLTFLCIYCLSSFVGYAVLLPVAVAKDIEWEMNKERKFDMYDFA